MKCRTLRDHIEATRSHTSPPDAEEIARFERLYNLRFDDTTLGALPLVTDREGDKRRDEIHAIGYALVGSDVDLELTSLRSLKTRAGQATPDFEATKRAGGKVRIELVRLVDDREKETHAALNSMVQRAADVLYANVGPEEVGPGQIHLRVYDGVPRARDAEPLGEQIGRWLARNVPGSSYSTRLWPADDAYPELVDLGLHWARSDGHGPSTVSIDWPLWLDFREPTLASFDKRVRDKAKKVPSYGDGPPIWLATYVDSRAHYALGTINRLAERQDFDPHPFERVFAGCFTAGVTFDPGERPRYRSITHPAG